MQSVWLPMIHARVALNRKNQALALNDLQASSQIELGQISFVANLSCLYPTYVRGEAYLAAGQGTAAAAEFQKILDHSGIVWNCWTGALAHLGVARANVLQSRTSQGADADAGRVRALAAYKDFLTLSKDSDPDPDIPILKEAKGENAKFRNSRHPRSCTTIIADEGQSLFTLIAFFVDHRKARLLPEGRIGQHDVVGDEGFSAKLSTPPSIGQSVRGCVITFLPINPQPANSSSDPLGCDPAFELASAIFGFEPKASGYPRW